MQQTSFADAEFAAMKRVTRRERFLGEMERVVPWAALLGALAPHYDPGSEEQPGRPPIGLERLLRMDFLQQWFGLSDEGLEDAIYDSQALRGFLGIDLGREAVPDATTLLGLRHLLEEQGLTEAIFETVNAGLRERGLMLSKGTVVDATSIAAPPSTKNREKARDPEMHQSKKGNRWHFGMKAHIGADADSGLVHSLSCTAANVADINETERLLHGGEHCVFADAGDLGADKRGARGAPGDLAHRHEAGSPQGHGRGGAQGAHPPRRAAQGPDPRPRRASLSRGQEPLRSPQGPLQGTEEEHRPVLHPVRLGQSGDRQEAALGLMHLRCARKTGTRPWRHPDCRERTRNRPQNHSQPVPIEKIDPQEDTRPKDRFRSAVPFVAFLAYCLQLTLKYRLKSLAPGLTPRAALEELAPMQMVDVRVPTTDGRVRILPRYTRPDADQQLLLSQLKLTLPDQPPPRIQSHDATAA